MVTKKPKKNIKQFKQALLSNTDFIKENKSTDNTKAAPEIVMEEVIKPEIREKFKILANFEGEEEKDLINKALNHYLRLKGLQLEEAMKMNKK